MVTLSEKEFAKDTIKGLALNELQEAVEVLDDAIGVAGSKVFAALQPAAFSLPGLGAATPVEIGFSQIPALEFAGSATNKALAIVGVPTNYQGGDVRVDLYWASAVGFPNTTISVRMENLKAGKDLTSGGPLGQNPPAAPNPPDATTTAKTTIEFTRAQADNPTAGDPLFVVIVRDGADPSLVVWNLLQLVVREV